jgi:hypothetical protein
LWNKAVVAVINGWGARGKREIIIPWINKQRIEIQDIGAGSRP